MNRRPGEGGGTHTHGRPCKAPKASPCTDNNHGDYKPAECTINGCRVKTGGQICNRCGGYK